MGNALSGIKKLRAMQEKQQGSGIKWVKLDDGQKLKVHLLQELDDESTNYSEKNGVMAIYTEHTPPWQGGFRKKFECTSDEGACFGCEMHAADPRAKWGGKGRLYVNVLVDELKEGVEPYVAVLSQGANAKNVVANTLADTFEEEDTVTNRWWNYSRKGSGIEDTTYSFTAVLKESKLDVEQYELFDLRKVLAYVPYEEQEAYVDAPSESPRKAAEVATSKDITDEWV